MRNPLGDVERCEAAESGITTEGDLQRTRRQTVSKLYQQQFFIFQYYSPHTRTESARARVNGPGRGVSREQRATTSDSLYVCTVSAATLPIYRDDEFRGHFDVPIPIEIHRLLPEIPANGGPVPTMMRLPAIHDQV